MHLVFFIRGVYNQVEIFKTLAQSQFWKWRRRNLEKKGREETILVQGAFRPSMLGSYEYIFPQESLAEVLSILGIGNDVLAEHGFMPKARLAVLRKVLGVKKIPQDILDKAKKIPPTIMINNSERGLHHLQIPGVTVHFIGIKEDITKDADFTKTGEGRWNQEMI